MYELGGPFPEAAVTPGTNLLVSGPPMTGKRDLVYRMLAHGAGTGEGAIIVSTKDNAERVTDEFQRYAPETPVGVVDCVTRQQGMDTPEGELVRFASSPVDLTGIGIELSELLQEFYADRGYERNRVLLYSLSTLLMYSNLQTVFRFLHVFTGRIQSASGLGLFVIDSSAHDDQTMSTLKQLFDGVIEVRDGAEGDRECRVTGLRDVEDDWTAF